MTAQTTIRERLSKAADLLAQDEQTVWTRDARHEINAALSLLERAEVWWRAADGSLDRVKWYHGCRRVLVIPEPEPER